MSNAAQMAQDVDGELLIREDHVLAQFREFDATLAAFTREYADRIYDLDNPDENKAARSDRLAIGKVVAELDRRHASIKAPLLEATRVVDGERKRIKDALLDVQGRIKTQIEAHEQREKDRIAAINERLAEIRPLAVFASPTGVPYTPDADGVAARLEAARSIALDDSWEDVKPHAALARAQTIEALERLLIERQKAEAEAAELARLRAEAEAKERQEREERIAREAADKARADAEAKAKAEAERVEQERREAEAQRKADEERERLERLAREAEAQAAAAKALAEAEERAARAAAEERARIEHEQAEKARKAEQERKADEARKAKQQHRAKIHGEVKQDLIAGGLDEATATSVVELIRDGKIAHVAISY